MDTGIVTSETRYAALADKLRDILVSGGVRHGDLVASEHDLVRKYGVSRVTVRKATDVLIAEGLLERRPGKGLFARIHRNNTGMIQFMAGNLEWVPCVRAARGVQQAAREAGVQVQIYDAHGSMQLDLELLRRLPESGAQGAIIHALHDPAFTEALYGLRSRGFPFVLVDQRLHDLDVPTVLADNYDGGYRLARHLLDRGHRRIGFIGDIAADTVRERLAGLRDAVGDAGLPFDRSLVVDAKPADQLDTQAWTEQIARQTRALLAIDERPSAIFAACDANARDVCRAAAACGLDLPAELSVVGFDDDPLAELTSPPLTTARQPFEAMGAAAFALLAARMADPRAAIEHRTMPVSVIARASVASPATALPTPA